MNEQQSFFYLFFIMACSTGDALFNDLGKIFREKALEAVDGCTFLYRGLQTAVFHAEIR